MKGLIFTYAMTYGGSAVALFNPFVGVLIYICFAIIKPADLWYWSVPVGHYSRIIAVSLLLGWLGEGLGDWRFGRGRPIVFAFIGFFIWSCFCTLFATHDPAQAYLFIESLAKILLPFLAGATLLRSLRQLKALAWVIMLSQAYVAYDLNVNYYEGYNRLYFEGFGGMDNNCVAIAMVTGTGLSLFLGLHASSSLQKLICLISSLLMMHCTMFGFSRGGMLALCITGCFAFFLIPKRPIHYLVFAVVVLLALRLAGAEVRERFVSTFSDEETRDESAQSRLDLWKNAHDTMQKSPIVGVGPNQWDYVAPEYGWFQGKKIHSLWLQIGAETGYPGMALLLAFYGYCIVRLLPLALSRDPDLDPWIRGLSSAVVASLIGFAIAAQFVSLTYLELPYYVALLGVGVLRVTSQEALPTTRSSEAGPHC